MATQRVSRLPKHILRVLMAEQHRSQGRMSMGHLALVKALAGAKSNISHSLRTLETKGWIILSRTPGGRAESLDLTPAGLEKASEI